MPLSIGFSPRAGEPLAASDRSNATLEPGFTHARPAAKHYDAHASVTACARRTISGAVKVAFTVRRKRAAPTGTVGGRIACARTPLARKRAAAANTRSFEPKTTETIGPNELGATGRRASRSALRSWLPLLSSARRSPSASRASCT